MSQLLSGPLCPPSCTREDLLKATVRSIEIGAFWAKVVYQVHKQKQLMHIQTSFEDSMSMPSIGILELTTIINYKIKNIKYT